MIHTAANWCQGSVINKLSLTDRSHELSDLETGNKHSLILDKEDLFSSILSTHSPYLMIESKTPVLMRQSFSILFISAEIKIFLFFQALTSLSTSSHSQQLRIKKKLEINITVLLSIQNVHWGRLVLV